MSKIINWAIEWGNPIAIGDGIAFVPQSLDGTHTATAYLISAAPAMLEALMGIASLQDTEENEWDAVERLIPQMCDIARAAIKKATGAA